MQLRWILLIVFGCSLWPHHSRAQPIPAFPGADGAGAATTGGRGGLVYHVTKLDKNYNDNVPGTLRYGLNDSNFGGQARTIVFEVAGTFWLGRFGEENGHDNGWDTQSRLNLGSNVTIAGQTAPGPVNIMGGVVKANGSNTIVRNVTIAPGYGMRSFSKPEDGVFPTPGDFPDSYVYDAIDISGQGILIDHVTTAYATDETISMNELADDVTIQYSNISQGQNYPQADAEGGGSFTGHAYGSLIQPGSEANISIHHNLYAHQKGRLPRVGTERDDLSDPNVGGYNDFRNNVFYNWFGTAGQGANNQPSQNNFINNFYLAGPGGDDPIGRSNPVVQQRSGGTGIFNGSFETKVYHSGNLRDINKDGDAEDTSAASFSGNLQATPFPQTPYNGVTDTATDAYQRVLDFMGSSWWNRSELDTRIVDEVRTGTGQIVAWADDPFDSDPNEGVEWRNLLALRANPTTGAAPFVRDPNWDTDLDGMPDHWEQTHGLPTDVANNNGDFDADSYTDLEEYLNELSAWPAPRPLVFTGASNGRYAEIGNWDIPWQPSRFDRARIEGSVAVDAVGQHAGAIAIADSATLAVTDGWLRVQDNDLGLSTGIIEIGTAPTDVATLELSGGELFASQLVKSSGSSFSFTGGELHSDVVDFDLNVAGGTIAPGSEIGATLVMGDASFAANSALEIEIAGPSADMLAIVGDLDLGTDSSLAVQELLEPTVSSYVIAQYTGILTGQFASVTPGYTVDYSTAGQIILSLVSAGLPGDFNQDGTVDAADYTVWRDSLGTTDPLGGNGDEMGASNGLVDAADYVLWRTNFGLTNSISLSASDSSVPEPATLLLLFCSMLVGTSRARD